MKSAPALTLISVGAILGFAITAHPSFLNIQVVGWVLMLTGIIGLVIPRRGKGWLRRSVIVKNPLDQSDFTRGPNDTDPAIPVISDEPKVEREQIVEYTEK